MGHPDDACDAYGEIFYGHGYVPQVVLACLRYQEDEGPLCRKYLKFNCIQTLTFGTHKETYPLCLNVSTEKGTPNHPNFAYENSIVENFNESWCMKIQ